MINNKNNNHASQVLLSDLVENILKYSDNPGECAKYVTDLIRELVGVRIVALVEHVPGQSGGEYQLINLSPSRKRADWYRPEIQKFVSLAAKCETPCLFDPMPDPEAESLSAIDKGKTFVVPLLAGSQKVGMIVLIGMIDPVGAKEILATLASISGVIALIIRNSLLFRNMENLVEMRTREFIKSERLFRALFEQASDGICFLDAAGKVISVNESFARMHGYTVEEMLRLGLERLDVDGTGPVPERMRRVMAGETLTFEAEHFHKNGHIFLLEVTTNLISVGNEQLIIATHRDITERNKTEAELRIKQHQLEELNATLEQRVQEEIASRQEKEQLLFQQSRMAAMGEMIGAIAHQWRQPLNVTGLIIQNLQMAYEYGELDKERFRSAVGTAMWQINFMSKTIDDFRNFFKPSKGKEIFEVRKVVDETISLVNAQLQNNYIDVEITADKEGLVIDGYPNEFKHVLLNLINNAKDAILAREAKENCRSKITITISEKAEKVILKIRDTGGGIPEGIMNKIFDPYFSTKEAGAGTGIGLYISKTMIERNMGGRLTARNWKEGAEFRIEV